MVFNFKWQNCNDLFICFNLLINVFEIMIKEEDGTES